MNEKHITKIIVGAVICTCMTIGACTFDAAFTKHKTAELVRAGSDPVEAKYAIRYTTVQEDSMAWMKNKCK